MNKYQKLHDNYFEQHVYHPGMKSEAFEQLLDLFKLNIGRFFLIHQRMNYHKERQRQYKDELERMKRGHGIYQVTDTLVDEMKEDCERYAQQITELVT